METMKHDVGILRGDMCHIVARTARAEGVFTGHNLDDSERRNYPAKTIMNRLAQCTMEASTVAV